MHQVARQAAQNSQLLFLPGVFNETLGLLFDAHHYTGGLALVKQQVPTNNTADASAGYRSTDRNAAERLNGVELYIERDDFMENPPKKFFRLSPGNEVRLRYAYFIKCREAIKNAAGEIVELRCTYDPATKGGNAPDGRKVQGTIHWVSARHAIACEVRLYDRLFTVPDPDDVPEGQDFLSVLNPQSLVTVPVAYIESSTAQDEVGSRYQFERTGYFVHDANASQAAGKPVYNRTVTLRDSWEKEKGKG